MGRFSTSPTLFDEVLQIHISKLIEWKYIKPDHYAIGTYNWSQNGIKTGSVSFEVNTRADEPYFLLDYKYRDEPRKYKINLVTIPSNLGRGKIWYFVCPATRKRARKLYSVDGYFLHREAFPGVMYQSQIYSKRYRDLFRLSFPEKYFDEIYSKHFKKTYAGKPTKRYLRLLKKIEQSKDIDEILIKLFG